MKVLLTTLNSKYVHTNLALRYLYKVLENICEVEIKEYTINMQLEDILMDITKEKYDLICFSTYIWNVELTKKLARLIKKVDSAVYVALGGPEATYTAKSLLAENQDIDFVMLGEGEETIATLVNKLDKKEKLAKEENGLCYRDGENIVCGNVAKVLDTNKIPRVAQMLADSYDNKLVYFESSRGCPFRCAYCLSSVEKTVRPFDITRVKEELKILLDKNIRTIKFVDRTFNYSKERALDLWKFIIENRKDTTCHFEIAAHILDDETIEFLNSAPKDAFQFEIGVQSTNKDTIKAINRNVEFSRIYNVVKKLDKGNIHMHLDLIAGLPYENYESFKNSFNEVFTLMPQNLQLGFLKVLSGCPINDVIEMHEYKYSPFPPYEVISNKYISYDELKKLKKVEKVLDNYNNSEVFRNMMKYILNKKLYNTPFEFFERVANYYDENGLFEKKVGQEESFDVLYDILVKDNLMTEEIKDILNFDYNLKYNSKINFNENTDENLKVYIEKILKDETFNEENLTVYSSLNRQTKLKKLKFVVFNFDIFKDNKREKSVYIFDREKKIYIAKYLI